MKLLKKIKLAAHEKGVTSFSGIVFLLLKYPFVNYLFCELASHVPNFMVPMLHRLRGVKVGKNVCIDRTTYIDNLYPELIHIEDGARVTAHCVLVSHISTSTQSKKNYMPFQKDVITIKRNAFIGVNSTILPGSVIGESSIVAAGSVVSGDIPARTLVGGNPVRAIRTLVLDEKDIPDV